MSSRMIGLHVFVLMLLVVGWAKGNVIESLDNCDDSLNEMDRAKVTFPANAAAAGYTVYAINEDCYRCAKTFVATIQSDSASCVSMWTPFKWKLYLSDLNGAEVEVDHLFGDHGEYNAVIPAGVLSLSFSETRAPIDSNKPLYILLGILGAIAAISFGIPLLRDAYRDRSSFYTATPPLPSPTPAPTVASHPDWSQQSVERLSEPPPKLPTRSKPPRLRSLDTFRGFSLLMMIFVNYGGGGYWFFDHAAWNGLTFADLLFPWFMWIMGVSMALSFSHILPPLSADMSATAIYALPAFRQVVRNVCLRSLKLFLLGMFLANGADYTTWRIPGVLQYFAASYFFVATAILLAYPVTQRLLEAHHASPTYTALPRDASTSIPPRVVGQHQDEDEEEKDSHHHAGGAPSCLRHTLSMHRLSVLTAYRYEAILPTAVLLVYLLTTFLAQAPGCPRGYNGPGGIGDEGKHPQCTGGIHRYLDTMLFTHKMIFHRPTCLELYQCRAYDPEGLLGVCTACVLTYLGLMTGRILLHFPRPADNLKLLAVQAVALLAVCAALCNLSQNEGVIPVNKNLWSVSFVCVCGGLGVVGLMACYLLVDVFKLWTGAPMVYLGMNSILIYSAHGLLAGYFPFSFVVFDDTHAVHLTSNAVGVLAWVLIAYYWYRRKFFVKV